MVSTLIEPNDSGRLNLWADQL